MATVKTMTPEERAGAAVGAVPYAGTYGDLRILRDSIAREIFAAIAEEREACAKVAAELFIEDNGVTTAQQIAAAIRARP